jgi:hypothetical protein
VEVEVEVEVEGIGNFTNRILEAVIQSTLA